MTITTTTTTTTTAVQLVAEQLATSATRDAKAVYEVVPLGTIAGVPVAGRYMVNHAAGVYVCGWVEATIDGDTYCTDGRDFLDLPFTTDMSIAEYTRLAAVVASPVIPALIQFAAWWCSPDAAPLGSHQPRPVAATPPA